MSPIQYQRTIEKKIEQYKKKHDNNADSEASFQKFLSNHKYTVQEFANIDPEGWWYCVRWSLQ